VTTRGFTADDCRTVAGLIADVLEAPEDESRRATIAGEVREMMTRFPLPGV
jgi:glycine hydroxymethyltransferase